MRIIALITDQLEVAKILKHIGEQTSRAPPLTPNDPVQTSCVFDDTNYRLLARTLPRWTFEGDTEHCALSSHVRCFRED